MFSTITYSNGVLEEEEASAKELSSDRPQKRLACLECRARKVKCTGEKVGCQRCLGNKTPCVYPESSRRGRRKHTCKSIGGDHDRKTSSSSSSKASSGPSSVHDHPLLPSTAPISDCSPTLNFSSGDLFFHSLPLGDDFSLSVDQLCAAHLDEAGDYSSLTPSSGIDPTSALKADKAPRISDSPPLEDGNVCNCAQLATQMLGELDCKISNITELSVDTILTDQKTSLGQLNSWLICEYCHSPRATTKVIVLVTEGLCFCLERAVADYVRQLQRGVEEDTQFLTGVCNIGDYHVNSWHEWTHILRVSLLCRCRELQAAVAILQERNVLNSLLSEADQKLSSMINQLKRCEGYL